MFGQLEATKNTFENIDPEMSAGIFKELTSGKLVNREKWEPSHNDLVDNKLYTALFNNMGHFQQFFQHMGYELVFNDQAQFFFVRKYTESEEKDYNRNAFKIYVALIVLARNFAHSGRDLKWMASPSIGLQPDDIKSIKDNDEYILMLRSADFKDSPELAVAFLNDRGFLFQIGIDRYIMSPAGMHFIDLLIKNYEGSYQETPISELMTSTEKAEDQS